MFPDNLPGAKLIREGLSDLREGQESREAFLVSIGAPRLRQLGVDVPQGIPDPEDRLYDQLATEYGDNTHERYNAFVRRLVRFEQALAFWNSPRSLEPLA